MVTGQTLAINCGLLCLCVGQQADGDEALAVPVAGRLDELVEGCRCLIDAVLRLRHVSSSSEIVKIDPPRCSVLSCSYS